MCGERYMHDKEETRKNSMPLLFHGADGQCCWASIVKRLGVPKDQLNTPANSSGCCRRNSPCASRNYFSAWPTVPDTNSSPVHRVLQKRSNQMLSVPYETSIVTRKVPCHRMYMCNERAARFPSFWLAYAERHHNAIHRHPFSVNGRERWTFSNSRYRISQ